jgi:hypothetical protein
MYHTVRIRDLEPQLPVTLAAEESGRSKWKTSTMPEHFWEESIEKSSNNFLSRYASNRPKYRETYFEANGPHTHLIKGGHAVFEAYLAAYNAHEDLVLSPDDIWLMITIYYSIYVVDNAEQLRHLFVDHEGKKKLAVEIWTMEPE